MTLDPLSPPPPQLPYFDSAAGAWVLSRYADVLAAFREPRLWPVSARAGNNPEIPDEAVQARVRSETIEALSPSALREWQTAAEPLARELVDRLPLDRAVDLLGEFAEPWSLKLASIVTGAASADCERLATLARDISAASADPDDSVVHERAAAANAELNRSLPQGPTFVALAQTLPRLLASAWLALLRHPREMERLHTEPELMPIAIEELLRFAGIPRVLYRRASASLELACIQFAPGDRVVLMLASANRDPAQFADASRLDITRRGAAQLTLGAGLHSCLGATLIRMAASISTGAWIGRFGKAELAGAVEWAGGSGFRSPAALHVLLK